MRIELNPVTRTSRLAGGFNTMLIYFPFKSNLAPKEWELYPLRSMRNLGFLSE